MIEACLFGYAAIVLFYVLVRILSVAGTVIGIAGLVLSPLRLFGIIGLNPLRMLLLAAVAAMLGVGSGGILGG